LTVTVFNFDEIASSMQACINIVTATKCALCYVVVLRRVQPINAHESEEDEINRSTSQPVTSPKTPRPQKREVPPTAGPHLLACLLAAFIASPSHQAAADRHRQTATSPHLE
jgi:hypothetical protein